MNPIPVFIGGTGRSGTSILKRVVARHRNVASVPTELRVIVDPGGALDLVNALSDRWSPYAGDLAVQRFQNLMRRAESTNKLIIAWVMLCHKMGLSPAPYSDFGIGDHFGRQYYRQRFEQLLDRITSGTLSGIWAGTPPWQWPAGIVETRPWSSRDVGSEVGQFFHDLYMHRGSASGEVTHWVEDTPYNLLHLDELMVLFPNVKFIHVYRDFRDVLASYTRQHWSGGGLVMVAHRLAAILGRWAVVRERVPPENIMDLKLEEMVAEPTAFSVRLRSFTGLSPCADMERHLDQLDAGRMHGGRWEKEIPGDQRGQIEEILGPFLERYGYV